MFQVNVDYPSEAEEFEIVRQTTREQSAAAQIVLSREEVEESQAIVRRVPAADHVIRYAMAFARRTRPEKDGAPDFVKQYLSWGAGPRASQFLILAAKARAVLHGQEYAGTDDVRAVAAPVLRHRIITNFNAEAEGITPDEIVRRLIDSIPTASVDEKSAKLPKGVV